MASALCIVEGMKILVKYDDGYVITAEHDEILFHVGHGVPTYQEQELLIKEWGWRKAEGGGWAIFT